MKSYAYHCFEVLRKLEYLIAETESGKSSSAAECIECEKKAEAADETESKVFIEEAVLVHKGKGVMNGSASQVNLRVFSVFCLN